MKEKILELLKMENISWDMYDPMWVVSANASFSSKEEYEAFEPILIFYDIDYTEWIEE